MEPPLTVGLDFGQMSMLRLWEALVQAWQLVEPSLPLAGPRSCPRLCCRSQGAGIACVKIGSMMLSLVIGEEESEHHGWWSPV